jgi:purine nucleosidase
MEGMPRTFLIDTDTASDDAVALIMALRAPDVRVAAITVVAGNVPLEQRHACFLGRASAAGSLDRPVDEIIDVIAANPGIVVVTLGPLTNVALALAQSPGIVHNVSRCVIMGGNPCTEGNVTPAAEFNMWVDPEAARMVLHSGLPIELVGWHLCRGEANLLAPDIEHVLSLGTELARFAIDCNRIAMEANRKQTGEVGIALPDPTAMAIALDPSICTNASQHYVDVETDSELTRGMTVVDRLGVAGDERNRAVWQPLLDRGPNGTVCWEIDIPRWKSLLYRSLV